MEQPEYMRMKLSNLPQEFVHLYNLTKIAEDNGNVYIKVQKGMYGLPQAGILAHRLLEQRLNEHGYQESQVTPGLWKHALRPISGQEHAKHLLHILNMHHKCSQDWDSKKYLDMDIFLVQAKKSQCVDVGICPQSANAVPTQGSKYATTSTIPTR